MPEKKKVDKARQTELETLRQKAIASGTQEDAQAVSGLDIYVDFMSIDSEHAITDECTVDLTNMIVKIPASYKDSILRFAGTCRMHLISIVMIRMKNI